MEFLILAGALIVGGLIGWNAREQVAINTIKKIIAEAETEDDESKDSPERMRLERHGEVLYAFTVEDDSFIAQGLTLEELDAAIQKRFPGKKFLIKESNLEEVGVAHERI